MGSTDPDFGGRWIGDNTQLDIFTDRDNCDVDEVRAVGFNTDESAVWDRLSFSGRVIATGLTEGDLTIFAGVSEIAHFTKLQIARVGDIIIFDLKYDLNGPREEHYELQKQS